jgi:charged multivesicular body protein 1
LHAYFAVNADTAQFTAKQLNRQATKAGKDEQLEKAKLKKVYLQPANGLAAKC